MLDASACECAPPADGQPARQRASCHTNLCWLRVRGFGSGGPRRPATPCLPPDLLRWPGHCSANRYARAGVSLVEVDMADLLADATGWNLLTWRPCSESCTVYTLIECVPAKATPCQPDAAGNIGAGNVGSRNIGHRNNGSDNHGRVLAAVGCWQRRRQRQGGPCSSGGGGRAGGGGGGGSSGSWLGSSSGPAAWLPSSSSSSRSCPIGLLNARAWLHRRLREPGRL